MKIFIKKKELVFSFFEKKTKQKNKKMITIKKKAREVFLKIIFI